MARTGRNWTVRQREATAAIAEMGSIGCGTQVVAERWGIIGWGIIGHTSSKTMQVKKVNAKCILLIFSILRFPNLRTIVWIPMSVG